MDDEAGPPLTDEEGRMLANLLARHCAHGMDQWDTWRLALPSGDVFVLVDDAPPAGWPAERFYQIWPPRPAPTPASSRPGFSAAGGLGGDRLEGDR